MKSPALIEAVHLRRSYRVRGLATAGGPVRAVDDVSLAVERGAAYGLVGESGSGKSTLARLLLGLERPDSGRVVFDGVPLAEIPARRLRAMRRRFQPVFQNPYGALNPYLKVSTIILEPLLAHGRSSPNADRRKVRTLLERVGLPASAMDRRPGSFSGGERQRIAVARALATEPELLVLDEPVSALDVSVQAQILNLLNDLRRDLELTMVFISHNLEVVHHICERTAVMYRGTLVEEGPTISVLERPAHPYTAALLSARPASAGRPIPVSSSHRAEWPPTACRFAGRCPLANENCRREPPLEAISPGHRSACWQWSEVTPNP